MFGAGLLKFWSGFGCMSSLKEACILLSVLKANQVSPKLVRYQSLFQLFIVAVLLFHISLSLKFVKI